MASAKPWLDLAHHKVTMGDNLFLEWNFLLIHVQFLMSLAVGNELLDYVISGKTLMTMTGIDL
jgi:hypothetical protein